MKDIVIAAYRRSAFTAAHKGDFVRTRPDDLVAHVTRAMVAQSGIDPAAIEDVIVGCAFPEAEQGMNIARTMSFIAGLPITVAGVTVNRFCGSSMQGIHQAAGAIHMGAGDVFVCAGVESMTRVPTMGFNPMPNPALAETFPQAYMSMGETAEIVALRYQISRSAQEAFAVSSHRKAAAAQQAGKLAEEIVAITAGGKTVDQDGCIRANTSAEALAGLKPAFRKDGSVTAGTSSPLTDGAAVVLVCSGALHASMV